uniref:Uncharacterized protein n=1 Tax=Corethron hystrix TaxID=216773 RepID=A0A7S1C2G1_9STRA|mmetsp:Transcript_9537/g.21168  ORF Transcript_9537/g.21168 Transcript_9537/m.21168 type:complete len:415 (+) Transcript_9537:106-1350(+)
MIAAITKSIYYCTGSHYTENDITPSNVEKHESELRKRGRELRKQVFREKQKHLDLSENNRKSKHGQSNGSPRNKASRKSKKNVVTPPRNSSGENNVYPTNGLEYEEFHQSVGTSCWTPTNSPKSKERMRLSGVISLMKDAVKSSIPQRSQAPLKKNAGHLRSPSGTEDCDSSSTSSDGRTFFDELQQSYTFDNFIPDDNEVNGDIAETILGEIELEQILPLRKSTSTNTGSSYNQQHKTPTLEFRGQGDERYTSNLTEGQSMRVLDTRLKETDKTYSSDSTFTGLWKNQNAVENTSDFVVDDDGFPLKIYQKALTSEILSGSTTKKISFGEEISVGSKSDHNYPLHKHAERFIPSNTQRILRRHSYSEQSIGSKSCSRSRSTMGSSIVGQHYVTSTTSNGGHSMCYSVDEFSNH